MATLEIKARKGCRFDLVSLGEVMLRLDPGDTRIHTARAFQRFAVTDEDPHLSTFAGSYHHRCRGGQP